MLLKTCNKCNTVYMGVSRRFAETEIETFNNFFDTLSEKDKQDYYNNTKSSIESYKKCWCGNNIFKDFKPGDCPEGCTLSSIIIEDL